MKHLTVEQIVEFVSLTTINDKAVALSAAVNGHIRHCGRCFDKVCAFQAIHDEFLLLEQPGSFENYIVQAELSEQEAELYESR